MNILLSPPIAFLIYLVIVILTTGFWRISAERGKTSAAKSSIYASGEAAPTTNAAPGYRQFFVVALFFAVLHLGVLMAGSGGLTPVTGAYVAGLILILIALILG